MERVRWAINALLAVCLLVAGAAAMNWLTEHERAPDRVSISQAAPAVAVQAILPRTDTTPVIGHGTVRAKRQVQVIPEVSGKLVYVHPDLAQGKIIQKGESLFDIEDTVYQARVTQVEAEITQLQAALARHDQEARNLDDRLVSAKRLLTLLEENFRVTVELFENDGDVTQPQLIADEQQFLRQRDVVAELENRRAMIPLMKRETQASLKAAQARLTQAEQDVARTHIKCPFDARVEAIGAHRFQVVTAYLSIATLTDMEAFEISVGIDPREIQWLAEPVRPDALRAEEQPAPPEVQVFCSLFGQEYRWQGRVSRFERVDEATRTARMVVEIAQTDMTSRPVTVDEADAAGPLLSLGMFCRTELPAEPLQDALFVPRHALQDNECVYVFVPDSASADGTVGHLERRMVPVLRTVDDEVLVDYQGRESDVSCGLAPGEQVVVSPLVRPVEGLRVRLQSDHRVALLRPSRAPWEPALAALGASPSAAASPVPPTASLTSHLAEPIAWSLVEPIRCTP
jgi:multidrug efflux system membrane fusion protein